MSIKFQRETANEAILQAAQLIANAARTAPKACGVDCLEIAAADKEETDKIGKFMIELAKNGEAPEFFARDGENLLASSAMVLIGARDVPRGIPDCGLCGFEDCAQKAKHKGATCAFAITDLGIAVGSAAALAADMRLDNRVLYSAGKAIKKMGLMEKAAIVYCLPLSASGKSPYFDRK